MFNLVRGWQHLLESVGALLRGILLIEREMIVLHPLASLAASWHPAPWSKAIRVFFEVKGLCVGAPIALGGDGNILAPDPFIGQGIPLEVVLETNKGPAFSPGEWSLESVAQRQLSSSYFPFSLDGSLASEVPNIFLNAAAGLVVNPSEHLGGCLVK